MLSGRKLKREWRRRLVAERRAVVRIGRGAVVEIDLDIVVGRWLKRRSPGGPSDEPP